jgi:alkaline phosphatase D
VLLTRRALLRGAGAAALAAGPLGHPARSAAAPAPFALGVASGDPSHESVVLWTRLHTGRPDGPRIPDEPVDVAWRIAADPRMRHVLGSGVAVAEPAAAHTVRVRATGLPPDAWLWYQFTARGFRSRIGRTRTFPEPGSPVARLRFAFASCQHWEAGFYTAYAHLAQEDLDFVLHLGDYIYEGGASTAGVRRHDGPEVRTLAEYRARHALYRSDPYLQAAHARFPFLVTWDDHETENNYAGAVAQDNDVPGRPPVPPEEFLARRASAYQAYFEHMPLDFPAPAGPRYRLFRRFRFGGLAQLNVLDTRQFRSNQPCGGAADRLPPAGDDVAFACGAETDPAATMTGPRQEAWLLRGLGRSRARWNVIAQQVMMSRVNLAPTAAAPVYIMDAWDGYAAARARLLGAVRHQGVENVVVVTGDLHSSWAADLRADFDAPGEPVVASEFVGTSITSAFPPALVPLVRAALRHPANDHVRFFDALRRGYVRCEVDADRWRTDFRAVATVQAERSPIETIASFEVLAGQPGVRPAE